MISSLRSSLLTRLASLLLLATAAVPAKAVTIDLYVDAAPNVYGSPGYAPWWAAARAAAVDGTFVNMANSTNGANAGTTQFEVEDATVYSFGDLGRRLHFVYWVPDETIASLTQQNFQLSLTYDWAGTSYVGFAPYTPTSWIEYEGGVIGTAGWAYWGAYGINTQAALEADLAAWEPYMGDITFSASIGGDTVASITAHRGVPDGGVTMAFAGGALLMLAGARRWLGGRARR